MQFHKFVDAGLLALSGSMFMAAGPAHAAEEGTADTGGIVVTARVDNQVRWARARRC